MRYNTIVVLAEVEPDRYVFVSSEMVEAYVAKMKEVGL